ncbi:prophage MuSo1, DNA transposition protein, putative [Vibrio ichthyoenteri ATCC 700023]|uniref:Prophage MuSo1, DNA transposition protein, putative n=1 Tax=Vibrio ichthyoenteri ATCC 700023 TaxID=870968 RepID=F9RZN4_9VIBR|nr:ATP-binding protein [Vibrio ichthyoenteri]EGU44693.1 prophage MuSo1, DNA transposition protein, putative [Vibrio ichthyoenteri ATCC 700023]
MKYTIAYTENVAQANILLTKLLTRSPAVPGIGLMDGRPGLGKTFATLKLLNNIDNGIYLRAVRLETASTFLERLLKELSIRECPRSKMAKFERAVDALAVEPRVIFLDEADYYMDQPELLEMIRDIHDLTNTPIILVGMDKIARKVAGLPQLDSRISARYEFQPATIDDLQIMVRDLFEDGIKVADDLLRRVLIETKGNYRFTAIALETIERKAQVDDVQKIDSTHWGDEPII